MLPSTKSLVMLLSTLLLGIVVGIGGTLVVRGKPPLPPPQGGGPGGFVAHMEQTIQPTDATQRDAILPILEATDRRNRMVVDGSRAAMRANLDSMLAELSATLNPDQRGRLTDLVRQLDGQRPGGPPPGGPGRGPPPR